MRLKSDNVLQLAEKIYVALISNPARYEDMQALSEYDEVSNADLTSKNINKAIIMAEQFYNEVEER